MNLQKGTRLDSDFIVLDTVELDEMDARGIWLKHEKCGAEVFHVLNDDSENLFAFAFATAPQDDTGVAHILEHSVFCGSQNYPLKDAFLVLAQGSLQTFLNAWTFPDKTVYPASSVNEHDYFNLMAVYGDAVFRPLLSEWTFLQEGHRYEHAKDSSGKNKLSITGVVYNEMKGSYSSLDAYADLWSVKSVMPGTPYAYESGGDPQRIPELTWEGLRDFHRRRYSPANCRIFLAGNIPTEKQLAFINEQVFRLGETADNVGDSFTAAAPIAKTERWDKPKTFHIPCPLGAEQKMTVFISWLCSDATDIDEYIALAALEKILLGHDGSPLTRALIESGLGEDISPVSGMEKELRETLFVVGLRGVDCPATSEVSSSASLPAAPLPAAPLPAAPLPAAQIEALIMGELKRLATKGIPREDIEAALLGMEFSQREIRRSGGPFSLVWMRHSLRGWMHGVKPWETLLFNPAMEKLKQRLAADSRYFESLIQKYLLDNPHRALVTVEPQENFLPLQEAEMAKKIADMEQAGGSSLKRELAKKNADLEKIQATADDPRVVIPHLSRGDLSAELEHIPRHIEDLRGIPALCHDIHTNGITYIDLAFPLDTLQADDYPWFPFFSRVLTSAGLPGLDYGEVSSLLARTVGGFFPFLQTGSAVPGLMENPQAHSAQAELLGRDWLIFRLKCLDEKTAPSLDLVKRLLCEADFSDERHIRDLVLEMKSELDSSLAPAGHSYASCRSGRSFSRSHAVDEIWNGLPQIHFAHRLAEFDTPQIISKLQNLRQALVAGGLIANLSGSAAALKTAAALIAENFSTFGCPKNRGVGSGEWGVGKDREQGIGNREQSAPTTLASCLKADLESNTQRLQTTTPVPSPQSLTLQKSLHRRLCRWVLRRQATGPHPMTAWDRRRNWCWLTNFPLARFGKRFA